MTAPHPRRVMSAFRRDLPAWFAANKRKLPWRENRTPYRVWISELMLQQTRVDQATPYFHRWIDRFPTIERLAAAPADDVLKVWEGLGYYSRARRAHETARLLVGGRNGRFPDTLDGLRALPGVGPYTAAAIGSLAFGIDAAVVDGNVARVLARVFAFARNVKTAAGKKQIQAWAEQLLPHGRAGEFNEAVMELGATVCSPRKPRCDICPLRKICRAAALGVPERFPVATAKKAVPHKHVGAAVIAGPRSRYLIAQRNHGGMLGGLWEFPGGKQEPGETVEECIAREIREELGCEIAVGPHLVTVRHAFSHFTMDLHAHRCHIVRGRPRAIGCAAVKWVRAAGFADHAFGRADQKIIAALKS
jgi:A/G-specific adenine glycosylase